MKALPYEAVFTELQAVCAALGPKDKVWICDKASCALTQVIPKVRGSNWRRTRHKMAAASQRLSTCGFLKGACRGVGFVMCVCVCVQAHRSPIPYTPLCLAKAVKNTTEIQGMKNAHVSDL